MNTRKRLKTQGKVFYLGIASGILMLIAMLLSWQSISNAGNIAGIVSGGAKTTVYLFPIIGFVIYPGIFIILLLTGRNKTARSSVFAIVWIVFSSIAAIVNFITISQYNDTSLSSLVSNALIPSAVKTATWFNLFGNLSMLASCILFLAELGRLNLTDVSET